MNEGFTLRDGYSSGTEVAQIREQISKLYQKDKSFYRIELLPPKTTNDPNLYNYRGLSIFSSTFPEGPVKLMQNLGYHSNGINSFKYEGSTILLDSIFGIKYLIHRSPNIDERIFKEIESTDEITVFENPYALPLGFLASQELSKYNSSRSNPFNGQCTFMDYICGVRNIYEPIAIKHGNHSNMTFNSSTSTYFNFRRTNKDISSTARINILVEQDQQVYLYLDTTPNVIDGGFIMLADKKIEFNASRSTIINPGFCKAGTTLELNLTFEESAPEKGSFHVYAYGLNLTEFEKAISLIQKNTLEIKEYSDTRIKGSIDADEDGLLLMSIPYDKGWHVKVDNEKVETKPISNGLLAFELPAGSHMIELWFVPEHFYTGLLVTIVSFIILILLSIRNRKLKLQKILP